MKVAITLLAFIFVTGCGSPSLITLPSLSKEQPRVVSVTPKNEESVKPDSSIKVLLSDEIEPATVGKDTFVIIENFSDAPAEAIETDISKGEIKGIEGSYTVSPDGICITFRPKNELVTGATYGVVLTSKISSPSRLPIRSTFISKFVVENEPNVPSTHEDEETGTFCEEAAESDAAATETETASEPETATEAEVSTPVTVVINELFYDSADTETDGHLFVELKGTPAGNIGGYKIIFVNGDDGKITEAITLPSNASIPESGYFVIADAKTGSANSTNVSVADFIDNFDPQNGPDAAQLLDAGGALVDAVCYGNVTVQVASNGLAICEGSPAPDVGAGRSITRTDGADTEDNAADFTENITPSPGE